MEQICSQDSIKRAQEYLAEMFAAVGNPFGNFKQETYEKTFKSYLSDFSEKMDFILSPDESVDRKEWNQLIAQHLSDTVKVSFDAISKRGKRDQQQLNNNMILVTYVLPAFMERRTPEAEAFADAVVDAWNQTFGTSVGKSTYDKIVAGFHRKLCYITTAVCDSLGKGDQCYELNLLRGYRDTDLMSTEEGKALVEEYYDIAPTIVTRINKCENASSLYQGIWTDYLEPCIRYLEENRKEDCRGKYMEMVEELKGRYIV